MIGKTLAHYEITGLLGKGGMGEVYRARDTKLKRDVALKVLPTGFASDPTRLERFQREAETVAGLSHPHIVHLYSVEEDQGMRFLTMELVEGQGLDRMLTPDGLPLSKVFEIGAAVADALAAAHEKGIVHRDLKPANVMVSRDGHVKVLDFGLAKLIGPGPSGIDEPTEAMGITREGMLLGTVPYMSPEQLRGDDVDYRSDIFSLGVLLYEMVAGRRPFEGRSHSDVTSAILRDTPLSLTNLKPELPRHLSRIVARCLEKEHEQRFQSAKDVRNELRGLRREVDASASQAGLWESGASSSISEPRSSGNRRRAVLWAGAITVALGGAALALTLAGKGPSSSSTSEESEASLSTPAIGEIRTLAVLPFVSSSGDPEQEYFATGMTEALNTELGKVSALNVISSYSARQYKDTEKPLREVAKELGADALVQGSVQQDAGRVRINVELILPTTGERLWGDRFDGKFEDALNLQSDVALAIVRQVKVSVAPFEESRLRRVSNVHPDALRAYLKAQYHRNIFTKENYTEAQEALERAVAIDPAFAEAYVALADVHLVWATVYPELAESHWEEARSLATRALEIDENQEDAYAVLAEIDLADWNWQGARQMLDTARELNPSSSWVRNNYSTMLLLTGQLDEGVSQHFTAMASNPLDHGLACAMPRKYYLGRQYDRAVTYGREAAERFPFCPMELLGAGKALVKLGQYDEAVDALEASLEVERTPESLAWLAVAHAMAGREAEARQILVQLQTAEDGSPYLLAVVHAALGETTLALSDLEKAYELRSADLPWLATEPVFDPLRGEPRFAALVERIGLPSEQ